MDNTEMTNTLIAAIVSGTLANIITLFITSRREERRIKRDLAADLFGYRYQIANNRSSSDLGNKQFVAALNRVPIVFSGCKDVLEAYDALYCAINNKESTMNDTLLVFLKAICKASGIKVGEWDNSRIEGTFNI